MEHGKVFVDWVAASQYHPEGGLPVLLDGVLASFDGSGNCRYERALPASFEGSYSTKLRVSCDGFRVLVSGNVGRFDRPDNLFNLDWRGTEQAVQRILARVGLPAFTPPPDISASVPDANGSHYGRTMAFVGCFVSRLDLTANYSTGSDAQARAVIRGLSGRSVSRMKRGIAGDESVWWSNTRGMLKFYRKGAEMKKHGDISDAQVWAESNGIVRAEVELKKRTLHDLGLNRWGSITDERLAEVFNSETEVFRRVDMSDEPDIIASIPARSRAYASAWLAGQDVRDLASRATVFRHAKVLRAYGLDILEPRNVQRFPVRVRVVDLMPAAAPAWHWTMQRAA